MLAKSNCTRGLLSALMALTALAAPSASPSPLNPTSTSLSPSNSTSPTSSTLPALSTSPTPSTSPAPSTFPTSSTSPTSAIAPTLGAPPFDGKTPWWQRAVFYEIYPRSFADGKNSGMGNLKGITEKLDHLQNLGIDAIWLTPCYPSPQVDFGYDISDYTKIAPEYGTMADFDKLVGEAKRHHIKILMDFVLNHTSDKHPWFVESSSSRNSAKRDWYIWRDPKPGNLPPNNWLSVFGHSAWQWDANTRQYYYHFFYPEQPDLNWRNKDVQKAMSDVVRFWLDKGVQGFRLDAVSALFEEEDLKDNPVLKGKNKFGDPNIPPLHNDHLPEVHDVLRQLRIVLDSYPGERVLLGETSSPDVDELSKMYGKKLDEVQLPMNFFFAYTNKLSPALFRRRIAEWDANKEKGWPLYFFSNHDEPRHFNRYGNGKDNDDIAKLMAAFLLTLRGTPLLYYGEEIGMENRDPKNREEVQDPIGKIGWPNEKGRDGERTPMQWDGSSNAGFSKHQTWLSVSANYKTHNVLAEESDVHSIFSLYKRLIAARRSNLTLQTGTYLPLDEKNEKVLSYLRKGDGGAVVVILNMQDDLEKVHLNLKELGLANRPGHVIASNKINAATIDLNALELLPFGFLVAEVPPATAKDGEAK